MICSSPIFLSVYLYARASRPSPARELSSTTRSVAVDGIEIRVRTAGFAGRTAGQPAVVFESGGATPLETWDPVLLAVARFAPVFAYDRAGTGESEWDGLPPTPERVSTRLRRLLSEIGVAPPYVLVGHSWGGALVRYFAGDHPDEVAGILYLDPMDVTLTKADMVALFQSIGAGAAEYEAFTAIMQRALSDAPAPLRAEAAVVMELLEGDPGRRALPAAPRVPSSVIVAGKVAVPPQNGMPFDAKAYAEAMHESQVRRLRSWVVDGGTFQLATGSGHFIHADAPDLVIAEIRRLATGLDDPPQGPSRRARAKRSR